MNERYPEHAPQQEITRDTLRILAEEGMVDDVNWAATQIPHITIAEVVPFQLTALRVRSGRYRDEARKYDDLSKLSGNQAWQDHMLGNANKFWEMSVADLNEVTRIENIHRKGLEGDQAE